ncbi:nucleoside-diphosphate sugar epimerase/dehydratase [Clostridium sp. TF11-13AC]|uniref:polysaccharide biosynthesis protein n=1 Tax=Clostridium sp. TF11-13AC TaxID=2293053 RepID=UPI000E4C4EBC|nr:nucleoside-diphosphate sugar epimerase/dehydratase [Clostridium sp. TF11-13AC]RHU45388.1 polysaccharide biosynthesis protein [Clostridium sp. TF11-13AC]
MNVVLEKYLPHSKRARMMILMVVDALAVCMASFLGLFVRFDMNAWKIPVEYAGPVEAYLPLYIVTTLIIFFLFRLYAIMWSVAGIREALRIVGSCALATLVQVAGMVFLEHRVPRSFYVICFIALTCMELGVRLSYRILTTIVPQNMGQTERRIMIVGAGSSGAVILKEMTSSQQVSDRVVCFIDDNPNKQGKYLNEVPIVGTRNDIPEMAAKYRVDEIYIAMPSASAKERKEIIEICRKTDCKVKTLPGIYQLLNGEVGVSKLREVQIEDLLGRDPIRVNLDEIMGYVSGKVVLVTGGGGSIGSELCRQIAAHNPKQLIIVDIYENNAYDIQMELREKYPALNLEVLIASVRNTHRIDTIFEKYRPEIVYHAAAHKHVPLMEDSPNEAIKNNVFGTYKTAKAADKYGVKRFVLISTDKAVNPTNIMGASKRMCEMVIQMMNAKSKTDFVAVRFGNVLGSNGSVIPLFKRQIAEGGPVTVTHPDIIRYFMTIPEAVSLVLQAGAYAKGGEIFVLDMGEPVKILDLAKNLIRLSGYRVDEDIKIEFTGLRPGEKLYEELLMNEEGLQDTPNKLIHIGKPIDFDMDYFAHQLDELYEIANRDSDSIKEVVRMIVPTYVKPVQTK